MMRSVTILGATGSIGRSTLSVIGENPERLCVESVVGGSDARALAEIAIRHGAQFAALADEGQGELLSDLLSPHGIAHGVGSSAVIEAAQRPCAICVAAIAGAAGMDATFAALGSGRVIALANKESLVLAGSVFMEQARATGTTIVPMDSEHNALFQALAGRPVSSVHRMTITASGGPFRTWSAERIASATRAEALAHPNWSMGAKITIDSASMMNKGLELIEAHHLFAVPPDLLEAVVHPQSIIHGMVSFHDGAVVAGLGVPDMRVPIAHCLSDEPRLPARGRHLDLVTVGKLTFEAVDEARFACFRLAREALAAGGGMSGVLNAANEIAVAAFLDGAIRFGQIADLVAEACETHADLASARLRDLADVREIDARVRHHVRAALARRQPTAT